MRVCPYLLEFTIYFVGSGGQLSRVFDLRTFSYLEHWSSLLKDLLFSQMVVEHADYNINCGRLWPQSQGGGGE